MRSKVCLLLLSMALSTCDDKVIEVTSLDQLPGIWRWESTCGGEEDYTCVNASRSNYATIEFRSDGGYIEKHMDTLFLQTNYTILKSDDMFGSLILEEPSVSRPVTLLNNQLIIQRGIFEDNYTKIKD